MTPHLLSTYIGNPVDSGAVPVGFVDKNECVIARNMTVQIRSVTISLNGLLIPLMTNLFQILSKRKRFSECVFKGHVWRLPRLVYPIW